MNGAFKGLDQSDVYLTSYISKKQWEVLDNGSNLENLGISKIEATSGSLPYVPVPSDETSSYPGGPVYNRRLAYEGFRANYYEGSIPVNGSFTGSYDLNLQSTITLEGGRDLPTGSVLGYSIPRDCFGETIEEGTISISGSGCNIFDKEGLLLQEVGGKYEVVGDVIYNRGLILLNPQKVNPIGATFKWTSLVTINTWNVNCKVKDLEYNKSYNPSSKHLEDYTPYITAVGLYNRAGELMAIAKMSRPIRKSDNIDMTFKVNIDIS